MGSTGTLRFLLGVRREGLRIRLKIRFGCHDQIAGWGDKKLGKNGLTGDSDLDRLHVVAFDADGQGTLDGLDGNYQAVILVFGNQDSFEAIKAATADADSLPHFEKGVRSAGDLVGKEEPHILELLLGNGDREAVHHHKPVYPGGLEDPQPTSRGFREADKTVAGKQRFLDDLTPVAPAVELLY